MAAKKYMFALTVAGALLLAGCHSSTVTGSSGLSTGAPATGESSAPSTAEPSTPATTPAPSAPAPSVTVTKTVAPPIVKTTTAAPVKGCTTSQVNVIVGQDSGAAGTIVQEMDVHNTSSHTCTIKGRPFISPYGKLKQGSSTVEANLDDIVVKPIPSSFGALGASATTQTVTPGDYVVFFFKWNQVPVGSTPCDNVDGYDFQTPGSSIQKLITFTFSDCGSELQVSNVMSKTAAAGL